jgi:hypothetical protein
MEPPLRPHRRIRDHDREHQTSVRPDGTDFYPARIRMPGGESTKRFPRLRDAEAWIATQRQRKERISAGLEESTPRRPTRALGSVNSEVQRWIDSWSDISERTRKDYIEIAANTLYSICGLQVGEVTAADIHTWVRTDLYGRGLSAQRVKKSVTVVGAMFGMLEASDDLEVNPVAKAKARWPGLLKPPTDQVGRVRAAHEPLTQDQLDRIAAAAQAPFDLAIHLLAVSGIRTGELLALEPRHRVAPSLSSATSSTVDPALSSSAIAGARTVAYRQ